MLGQITFGWTDKRFRQITGKSDTVCGGKSIMLIGDQGQLPPVGDSGVLRPGLWDTSFAYAENSVLSLLPSFQ